MLLTISIHIIATLLRYFDDARLSIFNHIFHFLFRFHLLLL